MTTDDLIRTAHGLARRGSLNDLRVIESTLVQRAADLALAISDNVRKGRFDDASSRAADLMDLTTSLRVVRRRSYDLRSAA